MLYTPVKRTIGERIRGRLRDAWLYNTAPTDSFWRRLGSFAYLVLALGFLVHLTTGDTIGWIVPLLAAATLAWIDSGAYRAANEPTDE